MKPPITLVAAVLVIGCTTSNPQGAVTSPTAMVSSNAAQPSPSGSSNPTSTPSPRDIQLGAVDGTCQLPVVTLTQNLANNSATYVGGFVSFTEPPAVLAPVFRPDSSGVIRARWDYADLATDTMPILYGNPQSGTHAPSYDASLRRWIPAAASQLTPDHTRYAYASGNDQTTIHVVDVAQGTEAQFAVATHGPLAGTPQVTDFDGSRVFFLVNVAGNDGTDIWRLDLASATAIKLAPMPGVMMVRGGYAWVGRTDPRDPSPPTAPFPEQKFNSIVRVDLGSGAETIWYYRPGTEVWIGGLSPTGSPIVNVASGPQFHSPGEIRQVVQPGEQGMLIYSGGLGFAGPHVDVIDLSPAARSFDRFWFGNGLGLYLYTQSGGMRKVFDIPSSLSANGGIFPAGDCR